MMIAEREKIERLAVLRNAPPASQRMEGLAPDAIAVTDVERLARAEITLSEAISNFKPRLLLETP
jgi:hypothetical protein